jgi:hypothetical protein
VIAAAGIYKRAAISWKALMDATLVDVLPGASKVTGGTAESAGSA